MSRYVHVGPKLSKVRKLSSLRSIYSSYLTVLFAGSILSVESNQNMESKTKNVESKTENVESKIAFLLQEISYFEP